MTKYKKRKKRGYKPTRKQRKAARRNIREAIKASQKISEKEHRKTIVKGRKLQVPGDENLYLGRTVRDARPEGYSSIREIEDTVDRILYDLHHDAISLKTANSRLMRLKGIIEQTKTGTLAVKKHKLTAVKKLNAARVALGFEPISTRLGPARPTPAQVRAARQNIEKARRAWMSMSPAERAQDMPGGS